MAFLCPSQLNIKKKVLQGKSPSTPQEHYDANGQVGTTVSEYKSALKSPSSSDSSHKTNEHRTVRIKENKHEHHIERKLRHATASKPANIRAKIVHDFISSDGEELNVTKGRYVVVLYQQNDWLYVKDSRGNEGFVPYAYCSTFNVSTDSKSSTSGYEESFEGSDEIEQEHNKHHRHRHRTRDKITTPTTYFPKRPYGPKMTVLYNYKAKFENDVRVMRGETVMLLNDQDPEWLWIATEDGEEGFIPRNFVISHTCEGCRQRISSRNPSLSPSKCIQHTDLNTSDLTATTTSSKKSSSEQESSSSSNDKNHPIKGTKLIALYDFEGTAFDDLNVLAGEYVYANLKDQIVPHWIWAYSPYRKRSGFIPEDYLKEPVITDI